MPILIVAVGVLIIFRCHAFSLPLENDECNYAYIGGRLLAGDRLYEEVWDHQPPGVFVLFAGLEALFGSSDGVFRWAATGFSIVSLVLAYVIVRREYGLASAALAVGVFAITSADPGTAGEGCNREIYMNTLALAALAVLTSRAGSGRQHLFATGLLLGLGSVLKTVVAAQWLPLTVWATVRCWRKRRSAGAAVGTVVWLGIGPALIWALVFLYFTLTGRLATFFDAVFAFNVGYSAVEAGFLGRLTGFLSQPIDIFGSALPLWIAGAFALPGLGLFLRRRATSADGAIIAYALGSFLAVCLPGKFWPHYYYLLHPSLVLLPAALLGRVAQPVTSPRGRIAVGAVVVLWVGAVLLSQFRSYLGRAPERITAPHLVYRYRQAWARAQGERVGRLTDPGDTVFIWGRDAGVYHYSGRQCASRYTMVGALADTARGYERRRATLLRELQARRPRLVLYKENAFDELNLFLDTNYVIAGPHWVDRDDHDPERPVMIALMDRERPVDFIDWEWPPSEEAGD